MKIGFSLGRCVRDIVQGLVNIDDVLYIIAATHITDDKLLANVISEYLYQADYLYNLDYDKCFDVAKELFDQGKVLQPRIEGIRAKYITEDTVWVDIFPTAQSTSETTKKAWEIYRATLELTNSTSKTNLDSLK